VGGKGTETCKTSSGGNKERRINKIRSEDCKVSIRSPSGKTNKGLSRFQKKSLRVGDKQRQVDAYSRPEKKREK